MDTPYITTILALFFFTGFVNIATTLSILRYGIGLSGAGFGAVVLALSLALSFVSVEPFLHGDGMTRLLQVKSIGEGEELLRPFLEKRTDSKIAERLSRAAIKPDTEAADTPREAATPETDPHIDQPAKGGFDHNSVPLSSLVTAFLVTELKRAFTIGLMILVPFLIIDLIVTNILMLLAVTQIPHSVISLPIKLLLFVAVDGWTLITAQLVDYYGS